MASCIPLIRKSTRKNSQDSDRISQHSDEGYGSDKNPSPIRDSREIQKMVAKDVKEFKEKYVVEKLLNNSANGVIYKGYRRVDSKPVCIKQVPKTRVTQWAEIEGRQVPKEFLSHIQAATAQGVVQVYDWFERKTSFVLVMEKPEDSRDFFEVSKEFGAIREHPARVIFRQVVESCAQLHSHGVLHRDIKDENILVNLKTLETKIIDFGCATDFCPDMEYETFSGTPEFCAPEIFTTGKYRGESSTVWTLGTLLYVILIGDIPFDKDIDITQGRIRDTTNFAKLSLDAQNLIKKMLMINPTERPTISEVLKDKWLCQL